MLALPAVALMSGCGGPVTVGEARRRDLFGAMLTAWVIGLSLAWLRMGRRRR